MNTMHATLSHYRWQQAQLAMPDILDVGGYFGNDLQAADWLLPAVWGAPIVTHKSYELGMVRVLCGHLGASADTLFEMWVRAKVHCSQEA